MSTTKHPDTDSGKGAEEREAGSHDHSGSPNLQSQIGHRDQDEMLKDSDTDFPEPGSNSEHSGQLGGG